MQIRKSLIVHSLIVCGLCALAGCSSTNTQQIVNSTSGDSVLAKIAVPTGQSTSIGASLFIGRMNNTTVLQPTSTNGVVHTPNLAVTVYGAGKQAVGGNAGGTNAAGSSASITDGSRDLSAIITGESQATTAVGTNETIHIGK